VQHIRSIFGKRRKSFDLCDFVALGAPTEAVDLVAVDLVAEAVKDWVEVDLVEVDLVEDWVAEAANDWAEVFLVAGEALEEDAVAEAVVQGVEGV
jgi:CO dehydrogenase/acetyl-CoA synthase beta subunit